MDTPVIPGSLEKRRRSLARRAAWIALIITALLLVAYFVVGAVSVARLTQPARYALGADPASYGVPFEDVTFHPRGDDSITLSGWFMPDPASRRAIVVVHGFGMGGCRTCGFKGRLGEFAAGLRQRGFSVLLFDLRGHGRSGDERYTFGLREQRDVEGAVDWLLARGFRPGAIGVLGESMGGAASILAAAEEPAIGALVTDSTFADFNRVLRIEFPRRSGLPDFFLPGVYLIGPLIIGEDLSTARPVERIGSIAPRPLLLIHGTADSFIPIEHHQLLAQSAPGAETWVVDGATHVEAYVKDPRGYLDRVARFFQAGLTAE
jgi:fermentation-respiration switch protein FrsA (DUF1100 family)